MVIIYNESNEYQYADRINPKKCLEMPLLLLRYHNINCDGDTDAMLAAYNQGNKNGINIRNEKKYVAGIYSMIGSAANFVE